MNLIIKVLSVILMISALCYVGQNILIPAIILFVIGLLIRIGIKYEFDN